MTVTINIKGGQVVVLNSVTEYKVITDPNGHCARNFTVPMRLIEMSEVKALSSHLSVKGRNQNIVFSIGYRQCDVVFD